MRRLMLLLSGVLAVLGLATAAVAEVALMPGTLPVGGVVWVEWRGASPAYVYAAWREQTVYLQRHDDRWRALIGADVNLAPGIYPLPVTSVGRDGDIETERVDVVVTPTAFPEERLTLPERMVSPRSPEDLARIAAERKRLDSIFEDFSGMFAGESWQTPVGDELGSRFGLRRILNGEPRSPHGGVDFRSAAGTPVLSPGPGKVVLADDLFFTGQTVIIDHGAGLYSVYAHLSRIDCRPGRELERGERLGSVGSTGRATGPHLHWGVRLRGDRVDPLQIVALLAGEKS